MTKESKKTLLQLGGIAVMVGILWMLGKGVKSMSSKLVAQDDSKK